MSEFSSRRLRCPPCRTEFVVEIPVSAALLRVETDFRPVFDGPDPIALEMHACPGCRYSGFADAFERDRHDEVEDPDWPGVPPPLDRGAVPDDDDLDALRRWIQGGELRAEAEIDGDEPSASERYLLALYCQEFLGHLGALALGDLALRGAWCARGAGELLLEQRLLVEAESFFDEAETSHAVMEGERGQLLYLSAEIARRTGDFGRAINLFEKAETVLEPDDEDGQRLMQLCRRQLSLAVAHSPMNAVIPDDEDEMDEDARPSRKR